MPLRRLLEPLLHGLPVALQLLVLSTTASRRHHDSNQPRQFPRVLLEALHRDGDFFRGIVGVTAPAHQRFQVRQSMFHGAQQGQAVLENFLLRRRLLLVVVLRIVQFQISGLDVTEPLIVVVYGFLMALQGGFPLFGVSVPGNFERRLGARQELVGPRNSGIVAVLLVLGIVQCGCSSTTICGGVWSIDTRHGG